MTICILFHPVNVPRIATLSITGSEPPSLVQARLAAVLFFCSSFFEKFAQARQPLTPFLLFLIPSTLALTTGISLASLRLPKHHTLLLYFTCSVQKRSFSPRDALLCTLYFTSQS